MNKNVHFWTIKHWMNRPEQSCNAFTVWASPAFVVAAKKAMVDVDEAKAQEHARAIVMAAEGKEDSIGTVTGYLRFRPEVGLAHIDVPGNACGLDLDFKSEESYQRSGFQLLPHNIDTAFQQSTLFAIWLWWAQFVELYSEGE